jgi:hypothetical protein
MNGMQDRTENANPQMAPEERDPIEAPSTGQPGWRAVEERGVPRLRLEPRDPRAKSPALACILSAIPGLGQIYVGYYPQGFIHAVSVGIVLSLAVSSAAGFALTPLLVIFLVFFWLYNIIDAGRRAALYNQALAGGKEIELPRGFELPGFGGSIGGGAILIAAGVILLLHTLFGLSLDWVADWWPAAPIAFGAYLLFKGIRDRSAGRSA